MVGLLSKLSPKSIKAWGLNVDVGVFWRVFSWVGSWAFPGFRLAGDMGSDR